LHEEEGMSFFSLGRTLATAALFLEEVATESLAAKVD
jgi:hypothetical protein